MLLLASVSIATGCRPSAPEALPFYLDASLSPQWLTTHEAAADGVHRVDRFALVDQHGLSVTEQTFAGKVTLVHFFFAQCSDVCPMTTRNVAATLSAIGPNPRMQVLSYSITPEHDSVPELKRFATHHNLTDARWHLLTGGRALIERLARQSFFARIGRDSTYGTASIAHTESVLLVDSAGRLRGIYAASLPLEMEQAAADARTLLALPSAAAALSGVPRTALAAAAPCADHRRGLSRSRRVPCDRV